MTSILPKRLYAAVLEIRGYIVGDSNARSGFHFRNSNGEWHRHGWSNIRSFGLHIEEQTVEQPGEPSIVMASGNGVLTSTDGGASWRVTTDWQVTEVLDIAVSPDNNQLVLAATAHGMWKSEDGCRTWVRVVVPESFRFSQSIIFDQSNSQIVLAACEAGILRSTDAGSSWDSVKLERTPGAVRKIVQDANNTSVWWAATARHGLLRSTDAGISWNAVPNTNIGPLFTAMSEGAIVAASGYRTGLLLSLDSGSTWTQFPFPDPSLSGHAIVIDPDNRSSLVVGTTTDGLFAFDMTTFTWTDAGLPDATVRGLYAS